MPIYEYQCEKCEHQFDTLQKLSEKPLKKCPECGKMALTKLVSAAGFRLKGGGWYETDFKSGNQKNLANSDSASGKDSKSSKASSSGGSDSASSGSGGTSSSKSSKSDKGSSKSGGGAKSGASTNK